MYKSLLTVPVLAMLLAACSHGLTDAEQLTEYLRSAAPPQVEISSAECDTQTGVCLAKARTAFHSPEPADVGYWCRVSTADGFSAECPGAVWLQGSTGTPLDEGLPSLMVPREGASEQEPCAGLSNTELLFCIHGVTTP